MFQQFEKISELIKSRLDPIPVFRLAIQKVADKNIIILDVEKGFKVHISMLATAGITPLSVSEMKVSLLMLRH